MDKTAIITHISQKTGIAADLCEKVIPLLEKQFGETLVNKFIGGESKNFRSDMLAGIAEKTGLSVVDCEKIFTVFEEVFAPKLSDKFKLF